MLKIPVIAVFDIGKTNKKLLLFNEQFELLEQRSARIEEIEDEDGFPCDDLIAIQRFVFSGLDWAVDHAAYELKAVNFSAYGASFVHIDDDGRPLTPLYNYLKPFPDGLSDAMMDVYGGPANWAKETASPVLGNLNSGLQLYRIKVLKPQIYNQIRYSLHLPQYLFYLLSGIPCSDLTSIGCHTGLWDFEKQDYHAWVKAEGINEKLAPVLSSTHYETVQHKGKTFKCGVGLHDSSAALVPYFRQADSKEPFALLSTGTWCITLNPFNKNSLTAEELLADCLSYLGFKGQTVKAARLFGGQEHDVQLNRIADYFKTDRSRLEQSSFDNRLVKQLRKADQVPFEWKPGQPLVESIRFRKRSLAGFASAEESYHQLMIDLVELQVMSMNYVLESNIRLVYIDGGFSKNQLFLQLLKEALPEIRFVPSDLSQATALGAAMALSG